jgi:Flp pilus assembly protein TadD
MRTHSLRPLATLAAAAIALGLAVSAPAMAAGTGSDATAKTTSLPGYVEAQALIKAEKYDEAIAALNGLNLPNDADVLNLLGYSHRKIGKIDEGIAYYLAALKVDPKHKGVHEYLGEAYLMKSDLANAEKLLAELKEICGFWGCDEANELTEAIEAYKKKQGS